MNQDVIKRAISMLLLGTGIFHLAVAGFGSTGALRLPLAVFGTSYFGLGLWTRAGGRTSVLTAMVVTALGIALGGQNYLENGGPVWLPIMFLIDVVVLVLGGLWLRRSQKAS